MTDRASFIACVIFWALIAATLGFAAHGCISDASLFDIEQANVACDVNVPPEAFWQLLPQGSGYDGGAVNE